jgi:type III restriction enzyme
LERERQLYRKGIKVLSLFFIDEVAKYRIYKDGNAEHGEYAEVFEDEYKKVFDSFQLTLDDTEAYLDYLKNIAVERTHAGYFSIDKKKNQYVDSKFSDKKSRTSDDQDAYDLIMKDKERLLSFEEDVRFIFSHSALREGWDNPNVFQICTLKQSGSEIRKRQEVGRGLRLCVNQSGERMDSALLGGDVHNLNVLTVIANESYDSFAKGLQEELADAVAYRPRLVTADLFKDKVIRDANGAEQVVDANLALAIYEGLIADGYVKRGTLTDKYYEDKKNGAVAIAEEAADCAEDIIAIIDSVYNPKANKPDNARSNNVELVIDNGKLASAEFKALWSRINRHSYYIVNFDEEELIKKAIIALNKLVVAKVYVKIEQGALGEIKSQEQLKSGEAFKRDDTDRESAELAASTAVRYDLIGKLVTETGLTRNAVTRILSGMENPVRQQFANNPEEFILKAAAIINEQAATAIIEHITYDKLTSVLPNILKRAIKSPNMYFMDTGLCAYLTRWDGAKTLEVSAMSGAFFETFAVSEILKSYYNAGKRPPIYYYRDTDGREIDLIIEQNGALYPIEIKKSANPGRSAAKNFGVLDRTKMSVGEGCIICLYHDVMPIDGANWLVPVWLI